MPGPRLDTANLETFGTKPSVRGRFASGSLVEEYGSVKAAPGMGRSVTCPFDTSQRVLEHEEGDLLGLDGPRRAHHAFLEPEAPHP